MTKEERRAKLMAALEPDADAGMPSEVLLLSIAKSLKRLADAAEKIQKEISK